MAWTALLLAGLAEIAWALSLKFSDGFTRLWPSLGTLGSIAISFALISVALKSIPFGTVYSIWTGIGAVGSVVVGIALFGESADAIRLLCVSLILAGVVGLKLMTP
jgi:quaternary ammonium compound-resistance protein SugE